MDPTTQSHLVQATAQLGHLAMTGRIRRLHVHVELDRVTHAEDMTLGQLSRINLVAMGPGAQVRVVREDGSLSPVATVVRVEGHTFVLGDDKAYTFEQLRLEPFGDVPANPPRHIGRAAA